MIKLIHGTIVNSLSVSIDNLVEAARVMVDVDIVGIKLDWLDRAHDYLSREGTSTSISAVRENLLRCRKKSLPDLQH